MRIVNHCAPFGCSAGQHRCLRSPGHLRTANHVRPGRKLQDVQFRALTSVTVSVECPVNYLEARSEFLKYMHDVVNRPPLASFRAANLTATSGTELDLSKPPQNGRHHVLRAMNRSR